jgi:excisionase family DNA binding protein
MAERRAGERRCVVCGSDLGHRRGEPRTCGRAYGASSAASGRSSRAAATGPIELWGSAAHGPGRAAPLGGAHSPNSGTRFTRRARRVRRGVAARVAELLADREAGPQGYLSVDAAAQFLACPKSGIYALASAGRIPVHRDGSRLLFRASEPRAWVD